MVNKRVEKFISMQEEELYAYSEDIMSWLDRCLAFWSPSDTDMLPEEDDESGQ